MALTHHRNVVALEGFSAQRAGDAVDLLQSGTALEFQDVVFGLDADGVVHRVVDSSWQVHNVTLKTATNDFAVATAVLEHLKEAYPILAQALQHARFGQRN